MVVAPAKVDLRVNYGIGDRHGLKLYSLWQSRSGSNQTPLEGTWLI